MPQTIVLTFLIFFNIFLIVVIRGVHGPGRSGPGMEPGTGPLVRSPNFQDRGPDRDRTQPGPAVRSPNFQDRRPDRDRTGSLTPIIYKNLTLERHAKICVVL